MDTPGLAERRAAAIEYGQTVTPHKIAVALHYIGTPRPGARHAGALDTEIESGQLAVGNSVALHRAILATLAGRWLGDFEIADCLKRVKDSVGASRNGLMMAGLVEPSGLKRPTGHGTGRQQVWRLTPLGGATVDVWRKAAP